MTTRERVGRDRSALTVGGTLFGFDLLSGVGENGLDLFGSEVLRGDARRGEVHLDAIHWNASRECTTGTLCNTDDVPFGGAITTG